MNHWKNLENICHADFENLLALNNIAILDIEFRHFNTLLTLPLHHGDPFDRLIIAQGITDNFILTSDDIKFRFYPIKLFL